MFVAVASILLKELLYSVRYYKHSFNQNTKKNANNRYKEAP